MMTIEEIDALTTIELHDAVIMQVINPDAVGRLAASWSPAFEERDAMDLVDLILQMADDNLHAHLNMQFRYERAGKTKYAKFVDCHRTPFVVGGASAESFCVAVCRAALKFVNSATWQACLEFEAA
jgi:hypothetical protein